MRCPLASSTQTALPNRLDKIGQEHGAGPDKEFDNLAHDAVPRCLILHHRRIFGCTKMKNSEVARPGPKRLLTGASAPGIVSGSADWRQWAQSGTAAFR